MNRYLKPLLALLAMGIAGLAQANTLTLTVHCELARQGDAYAGQCSVPCSVNALAVNFDGVAPSKACADAPRQVPTQLARTAVANRWLGQMVGVKPEDPTRAELVPDGNGGHVARLPYGWFAVNQLGVTEQTLRLAVDASRQVRPNAQDLAILDRALALLPNEAVWNKADNRQCPSGQARLSLFCALMQATTEISGGVHYRQPAMQAVREVLNTVDARRIQNHRIMDFNNHPDTQLSEIHALLKAARIKVAQDIR